MNYEWHFVYQVSDIFIGGFVECPVFYISDHSMNVFIQCLVCYVSILLAHSLNELAAMRNQLLR